MQELDLRILLGRIDPGGGSCIMTILMAGFCFILVLNCRSLGEHCLNKCLFKLHFEYHPDTHINSCSKSSI